MSLVVTLIKVRVLITHNLCAQVAERTCRRAALPHPIFPLVRERGTPPYTLHPTPYAPCALRPAPCTLHPAPDTQHQHLLPAPYTMHFTTPTPPYPILYPPSSRYEPYFALDSADWHGRNGKWSSIICMVWLIHICMVGGDSTCHQYYDLPSIIRPPIKCLRPRALSPRP
jgi:hypothetical protein